MHLLPLYNELKDQFVPRDRCLKCQNLVVRVINYAFGSVMQEIKLSDDKSFKNTILTENGQSAT